ncbi:ATP12 family chaperone protein [Halovulum sp. GXIMD14793]
MSLQVPRRFWTDVAVVQEGQGYAVRLDDKPLRTPHKSLLLLPNRGLADALAAEWQAVGDTIDPEVMSITRSANSAIDKVAPQKAAVAAMLADYAGTDLLCYRAETPQGLVQRQAAAWDHWLDWSRTRHDAPLVAAAGVMHHPQPPDSLFRLAAAVTAHDAFEMTALHDLITLAGSCVLGLAISDGALDADEAWSLSRIDEDWQAEQWGQDEEAEAAAAVKHAALRQAERFLALVRKGD